MDGLSWSILRIIPDSNNNDQSQKRMKVGYSVIMNWHILQLIGNFQFRTTTAFQFERILTLGIVGKFIQNNAIEVQSTRNSFYWLLFLIYLFLLTTLT